MILEPHLLKLFCYLCITKRIFVENEGWWRKNTRDNLTCIHQHYLYLFFLFECDFLVLLLERKGGDSFVPTSVILQEMISKTPTFWEQPCNQYSLL